MLLSCSRFQFLVAASSYVGRPEGAPLQEIDGKVNGNSIILRKKSSSFYRNLVWAPGFMGQPESGPHVNNVGKRGKTAFARP